MSTLYVRKRTLPEGARRFDVKYRRGGRYTPLEHGGTFKTRREANERRNVIGDMLARGENPKLELRRLVTPGRSLIQISDKWIASRRRVADRTREAYRSRMRLILDTFGDTTPSEIAPEDVMRWIAKLEGEYAPGSVGLFVAQLRMMLDFSGGPNPARDRRVELPRHVRHEPDPPDAPSVLAMLAALPEQHLVPALVMEVTGARVSETLSLERSDVDGERIRIRREVAKGQRHGRWIPVPAFVGDALPELLPMHVRRQALAQAMRRAGEINPHALRHRRATLWYQQGIGPVELAQRLGHARPSMSLDVYAHVRPLEEIQADVLASFFK